MIFGLTEAQLQHDIACPSYFAAELYEPPCDDREQSMRTFTVVITAQVRVPETCDIEHDRAHAIETAEEILVEALYDDKAKERDDRMHGLVVKGAARRVGPHYDHNLGHYAEA